MSQKRHFGTPAHRLVSYFQPCCLCKFFVRPRLCVFFCIVLFLCTPPYLFLNLWVHFWVTVPLTERTPETPPRLFKNPMDFSVHFVSWLGQPMRTQVGRAQHIPMEFQQGMCWLVHLYVRLTRVAATRRQCKARYPSTECLCRVNSEETNCSRIS